MDQGLDVPMLDATGDSAPNGGQDQGGQPDQGQQPNPEALVPGNQEGPQLEQPQDNYAMSEQPPPLGSLKDRNVNKSSKELVSV